MCISGCTPTKNQDGGGQTAQQADAPDWATLPEGFAGGSNSDGWWAVNCPDGTSPVVYATAVEGSIDFDAELVGRGIAAGSVTGGSQFAGQHVRCEG